MLPRERLGILLLALEAAEAGFGRERALESVIENRIEVRAIACGLAAQGFRPRSGAFAKGEVDTEATY